MDFWIVASLATFLMGLSKGGLPMIALLAVPLMSLYMDPALAAGLLLTLAGGRAQDAKAKAESPKARVNRQFAAHAPALGSPLPDITIYDARGKKFPLRNLKGSHAVIVFGCLT